MLLGTYSIGSIIPILLEAQLAIGVTAAELQAKLDALIALSLQLQITPPTIDASILAALSASIEIGLPSINIQATAVAQAILDLELSLGKLNAFLAIAGILGTSGIHLYMVTGRSQDMGAQLNADLAPGFPGGLPDSTGIGFLLAASEGPAKVALKAAITIR
jgi:hypothetical protein